MGSFFARLWAAIKAEPAFFIGVLASAVLVLVQALGGRNLLSGTVVDWFVRAFDPNSGWAIPIIVGLVTRFFVYAPPTVQKIADNSAATGSTEIGSPPSGSTSIGG